MAKKPINVFITEDNHKTQPFTVRIEQGKTDTILSQRYTRTHSAKLGALRKLGAQRSVFKPGWWVFSQTSPANDREVVFTVKRKSTTKTGKQ